MRRISLFLVLAVLAGCKPPAAVAPTPEDPIPVMGTSYGLADILKQVGGDQVRVGWITEAGRQLGAEGLPSDESITELKSKRLLITNGLGEPWATSGFDDPIMSQRIIRLDIRLPDDVAAVGGALWLDPTIAIAAAEEAARRLAVLRPARQSLFDANAKEFAKSVRAAWSKHPQLTSSRLERPTVLTLSPQFAALLLRSNLNEQPIPNVVPSAMTEEDLKHIRKAIARGGVVALIVDTDSPELLRKDISHRTGLPVFAIDAQGSSSAATGRDNYLKLLEYDLQQVAEIHKLPAK